MIVFYCMMMEFVICRPWTAGRVTLVTVIFMLLDVVMLTPSETVS